MRRHRTFLLIDFDPFPFHTSLGRNSLFALVFQSVSGDDFLFGYLSYGSSYICPTQYGYMLGRSRSRYVFVELCRDSQVPNDYQIFSKLHDSVGKIRKRKNLPDKAFIYLGQVKVK